MLEEDSKSNHFEGLPLGPETPVEPVDQPIDAVLSEPAIAFHDVSISFSGRAILEEVSFSIARGQTLCILGRSGVGTSVPLRILMSFLKPNSAPLLVRSHEL